MLVDLARQCYSLLPRSLLEVHNFFRALLGDAMRALCPSCDRLASF
jgi:hypothetical protein